MQPEGAGTDRVAGAAGEHPPRRPPPSLSSDTESVRRAAADSTPPPAQAAFRLHMAAQGGHYAVVGRLIAAGADANQLT